MVNEKKADLQARCWFLTLQIKNFENLNIPPECYQYPIEPESEAKVRYEALAQILDNIWCTTPNRTAAITVCVSADGLFHVHMAAYSKTAVRFSTVHKLMGQPHIELQRGSKDAVKEYLLKQGKYKEKGEQVLYSYGIDNIQDSNTVKDYLEEASKLLSEDYTPNQIYAEDIHYRRYAKEIQQAFLDRKLANMPAEKDLKVYWHCGASGTGKTRTFAELVEKYSRDSVYFYSDFEKGGLDGYAQKCCDILFIDELRPDSLPFRSLLGLFDVYVDAQSHARYNNVYNLWTQLHVTSILDPYQFYEDFFTTSEQRRREPRLQFLRRITEVVWHYKDDVLGYGTVSASPLAFDTKAEFLAYVKDVIATRKQCASIVVPDIAAIATTAQATLAEWGAVPVTR